MSSKQILYSSALLLILLLINVAMAGKGGGGPAVGDVCIDVYDCDDRYQICENSTRTCQCKPGAFEVDDGTCSTVLGDRNYNCRTHCDCTSFVPNSRCIANYICTCKEGYIKKDNTTCVAGPAILAKQRQSQQCICKNAGNIYVPTTTLTMVLFSVVALVRV